MGHRGSRNHPLFLSLSFFLFLSLPPATEPFPFECGEHGVETVDIVPDVSDRVENQALANPLPTAAIR